MSAFTALNIEYDNVSEPEVDDTKELQIEDALKLYQTALKYHSEGPQSYDKALDAYRALFESEIFKYSESLSELRRSETYSEYDELWVDNFAAGPVQLAAPAETAPNTLPQILHLSYKNHGQFLLDLLQYRVQEHLKNSPGTPLPSKQITDSARGPLDFYSEALDKDDTDVDLWRSTSAVATLVGSNRIARFCLEATLDMGDEGLDVVLGLAGIEQTIALQRLQELSQSLRDDLSLLLAPLSTYRRKRLADALKKRLESHPSIPKPAFEDTAYSLYGNVGRPPTRYVITAPRRDWAAVGEVILQQQHLMESGLVDAGPGVGLGINLPEASAEETAIEPLSQDTAPTEAEVPPKESEVENNARVTSPSPTDAKTNPPNGDEDAEMADADATEPQQEEVNAEKGPNEQPPTEDGTPDQPDTSQAPSRKRSTDSAGLLENADGGRIRSKRIRNREVLDGSAVDGTSIDTTKQSDDQLQTFVLADEYLFNTTNIILGKLRVSGNLGSPQTLRAICKDANEVSTDNEDPLRPAIKDFYNLAKSSPLEMAGLLSNGVNGETIDSLVAVSREAGLNAFLGHTKSRSSQTCAKPMLGSTEGLIGWLELINASYTYNKDAAWLFLVALLEPGSFPSRSKDSRSSYLTHRWSDDLKRSVVQIAVRFDDYIYPQVGDQIANIAAEAVRKRVQAEPFSPTTKELHLIEMVQTLFELHLDVYSLIKRPGSNVDAFTKIQQKDRLERWSALANNAINLRISGNENPQTDELAIRHIWATAFHISVCDNVSQSHVLACMKDLKSILISLDEPCIQLQNNAVIPEISMATVEQELSKINMKDFFVKVFSDQDDDPITTIESLEPLLELSIQPLQTAESEEACEQQQDDREELTEEDRDRNAESLIELQPVEPSPQEQMSKFLSNASWSLRLSLWQRLRQAYIAIDYPPKVASCLLRSIELLANEIKSATYLDLTGDRSLQLLGWLHLTDQFIRKLIALERTTANTFECIDADHLQTSLNAVVSLLRLLQAFNLYEDQLRVGCLPSPTFEGRTKPSFTNAAKWIHDLELRTWTLFYSLIKEGMEQDPEAIASPAEAKFEFLRDLHYTLGVRSICNAANREFLHLLMDELLQLSDIDSSDLQLSQVLLDLYGLKCAPNPSELMDHGCVDVEMLNRRTAEKLLGFIMSQAQKLPMKDLPRTDLKTAIDKVHGYLGRGKGSDDLLHNRRVFNAYIKSTINPLDLFSSLRGTFELSSKPIPPSEAVVAAKGWYFLMGLIALSKFRSQKRTQPGPMEDLNIAVAFFTQDLEYSTDQWETWYRLAQAHDLQLEENVAWSAEKLNSNSHEVFYYQRAATHCYAMAASCAVRSGDASTETSTKMAEMYAEFGNRVYSSSREPYSMLAFAFRDHEEKHFSGNTMYRRPPFNPLQLYTAWKVASVLFKRSIARVPDQWLNHYMLGKCLWKMYTASNEIRGSQRLPAKQEMIDAFVKAIETLPNRRDSRKEPILEPHYKLVSIIHKLVQRKDLAPDDAMNVLQASSYAAKVARLDITKNEPWEDYVMNILKTLRGADKSGWHHRMTARAAHLIYDDDPNNTIAAMGVKNELTQQMFTKTMVLQVWRPENERPGRHYVYTTRYLRFFVRILVQLGDRQNLELLVRRLRRKPNDFFDHVKLWQETCLAYLKLLRKAGSIPEGYEDAIFKSLNHEDFSQRSTRLEIWCQSQEEKSTTLEILGAVIELKKLNNGLMKPTLIDDLLGDTYARLYEEVGPELNSIPLPKPEPPPAPLHKPMALTSVMNLDGAADQPGGIHAFQSSYIQQQPGEHVSKPRSKGVGRRELQRKAEAAVTRPAAATPSIAVRSTPQPSTNLTVQVIAPSALPSSENPIYPPGLSALQEPVMGEKSAGVSAPASIHEDADDESELSELEEEPEEPDSLPSRSMFPNLMAKATSSDGTSGTAKGEEKEETDEIEQPRDG